MKLTSQKLHAELRKAGLRKSYTTTTRIRGWHDLHSGYRLWDDARAFYVDWVNGNRFMSVPDRIQEEDAKAKVIAAALAARAARIEMDVYGSPRVVIPKPE